MILYKKSQSKMKTMKLMKTIIWMKIHKIKISKISMINKPLRSLLNINLKKTMKTTNMDFRINNRNITLITRNKTNSKINQMNNRWMNSLVKTFSMNSKMIIKMIISFKKNISINITKRNISSLNPRKKLGLFMQKIMFKENRLKKDLEMVMFSEIDNIIISKKNQISGNIWLIFLIWCLNWQETTMFLIQWDMLLAYFWLLLLYGHWCSFIVWLIILNTQNQERKRNFRKDSRKLN